MNLGFIHGDLLSWDIARWFGLDGRVVGESSNRHVVRRCFLQTAPLHCHPLLLSPLREWDWSGNAQSELAKEHDIDITQRTISLYKFTVYACKDYEIATETHEHNFWLHKPGRLRWFQPPLHCHRLGFHKLFLPPWRALPSWRARWRGQLVLVWKAVKGGTWPPGPSERQDLRQWERPLTFWDIFVFLNSLKWFS